MCRLMTSHGHESRGYDVSSGAEETLAPTLASAVLYGLSFPPLSWCPLMARAQADPEIRPSRLSETGMTTERPDKKLPERRSAQRKTEVVMRVIRGEELDEVAHEIQLFVHEVEDRYRYQTRRR